MILAIIFLVIFAGCVGLNMFWTISLVKTPMIETNFKKHFLKNGLLVLGATIAFLIASFGFYMWLNAKPDFWHVFQLVVGEIFFIGGLLIAINFFILHYYGKNIHRVLDKFLFVFQLVGFVISTFALFIYTNGLAPYLTYPLVNGISFKEGFVTPASGGSPNLAFYAICILSGAIIVYFVCDHYMYKEYGKHGTLESTFFVAFPAGIIGARIWYVVGNWNQEFAGKEFYHVFAIWEGGLTILGGAIMGIVVGVLWFLWRNKKLSIWFAVDMIVPTILIAQAVGRWGNFFNCEVHGLAVDVKYFKWLPEIIWRNAQYSSAGEDLRLSEQMYVPLFFIECVSNLFGYFLIAHVFGKALGKYREPGDLCFAYVIWYGLTRVLMEPLRSADFQMGENGYWSWVWSMVFVLAGTLLIVINHLIRFIIKITKKLNVSTNRPINRIIFSGVFMSIKLLFAIGFIVAACILMATHPFKAEVAYNGFNIGLMCLIAGISLFIAIGATNFTLLEGIFGLIKRRKNGRVQSTTI